MNFTEICGKIMTNQGGERMENNQQKSLKRTDNALMPEASIFLQKSTVPTPGSMRNHHYHDYYEVYYLLDGDRYYFVKDKTYHIKSGSFVLIKPYDIHSTSKANENGYERYLISFRKKFLEDFLKGTDGEILLTAFMSGGNVVSFSPEDRIVAENILSAMLSEYQQKRAGYLQFLKASLMQLLLIVARYGADGESKVGLTDYFNPTHKTVSTVAAYINNNYSEDITLTSISNRFFISPCYFSRIFKAATGFSFVEYLNGVRLKEARKLLAKTNMTVSDIGDRVGYKSNTHFGRAFKTAFGISPTLYRKKAQSEIYASEDE